MTANALATSIITTCQDIADAILATFQDGLELTEAQACWAVQGHDSAVHGVFMALEQTGVIQETGRFSASGSHIYSI